MNNFKCMVLLSTVVKFVAKGVAAAILLTGIPAAVTGCASGDMRDSVVQSAESCSVEKQNGTEKFVVELSGNPTTGYVWEYTLFENGIVSVLEDSVYEGESEIVGAPSVFVYTLVPLKPGKVTVSFTYLRPWQRNSPIETILYVITVEENGTISGKKI